MNTENVFISGGSEKIERQVRSLVSSSLAQLESGISIMAIKIDYAGLAIKGAFQCYCTILAKLENGNMIRSRAQDCDEMLAIYRALSKTIDSLPQEQNRSEFPGKGKYDPKKGNQYVRNQ